MLIQALALVLLSEPTAQDTYFVHANVLPMDADSILMDHTVVVRGGLVQRVVPSSELPTLSGALRVDCTGKYVIPGLTDIHVHLNDTRQLLSHLTYGVTTIFELDGRPSRVKLREEIRTGKRFGPTLFVASRAIDGYPIIFGGHSEARTPEEGRELVRQAATAGYDLIKMYNNVSSDVHRAICDEAKKHGLSVIGHLPRGIEVYETYANGQRMIAHAEEYFFTLFEAPRDLSKDDVKNYKPDRGLIAELVKKTKEANVYVTPNLSFIAQTRRLIDEPEAVYEVGESVYISERILNQWKTRNPRQRGTFEAFDRREKIKYPLMRELTLAFQRSGVKLLAGTDASQFTFPGYSLHEELHEMQRAGLTPFEALQTATYNAGLFTRETVPNAIPFGRIAPDSAADLLILDANPLDDLHNLKKMSGLVVRGKFHTREEIRNMRDKEFGLTR